MKIKFENHSHNRCYNLSVDWMPVSPLRAKRLQLEQMDNKYRQIGCIYSFLLRLTTLGKSMTGYKLFAISRCNIAAEMVTKQLKNIL